MEREWVSDDNDYQPLPHSEETERALLGSILLDSGLTLTATNELAEQDFYVPRHRNVFAAIKALRADDATINPVTVVEQMKRQGINFEGVSEVSNLTYGVPLASSKTITNYIAILREHSQRRRMARSFAELSQSAIGGDESVEAILSAAGAEVDRERRAKQNGLETNSPLAVWVEPPKRAAWRGLAGELCAVIDDHTEADAVAVLVQILVAFGNIIGRKAHFKAEAAKHYLNLFVVLVGATAKGRKGSSWSQVRRLFEAVEATWKELVKSGLSSGEGLIWNVRDAIEKREPIKKQGRVVEYQSVTTDEGIADKRLLVIESEFAMPLRQMSREGNILSATLRQAWDEGDLRVLTKNSPAQSTGAHVSIIGHITRDELLRNLGATEQANGFANRFLWLAVHRSKFLPEGGALHEVDFAPIVRRLAEAVGFACHVDEMRRDDEARRLWHEVYPELSTGVAGMLGAVTSRAEAQTMRLACLYALLDLSVVVRRTHLESALALWTYCQNSARFIFGDSLGDPVADEVLQLLRSAGEQGMTRTDLSNHFNRHRGDSIARALRALAEAGMICSRKEETKGRPVEKFFAVTAMAK